MLHHGPTAAHPTLGWTTPELSVTGEEREGRILPDTTPWGLCVPPAPPCLFCLPHADMDVRHIHTGRDQERVCARTCLGALMACSINHEMMKGISFI